MNILPIDHDSADAAARRLFTVARSDTGQARRVANFLLAWWNGDDWGHFPIADLFGLDRSLATDIATIVGYLSQQSAAVYPDRFLSRDDMAGLVRRWRDVADEAA
jgi:hypothetical protein